MGFKDFLGNVVSETLNFTLYAGKPIIRNILHSAFKKTVIKSLIKLILCVLAVGIAAFTPFSENLNLWISSILFIGTLAWGLVDFILLIKNNFMLLVKIIQEGSISSGIEEFIKWRWSYAYLGIGVYETLRSTKRLNNFPSTNTIIKDYLCYLAKDIILFAILFSTYVLLVYWIIKPIILLKYAGLTSFQIYIFPIVKLIEFLK